MSSLFAHESMIASFCDTWLGLGLGLGLEG